jgi:tungstate transport system permease protein|tara:strand:+ start:51 stop:752 length:702 start_codon:yes stop_codon:yes gene_type:complete
MDFHLEFIAAINNILDLESGYIQIILTSLSVSIAAIIISFLISIPMASILATKDFYGKSFLIVLVNTSMALPPVVVGLLLYIIFSNQGVLGSYNLLYTVNAMIIAQTILITPILISLSQVTLERYYQKYNNLLLSMHASYIKRLATLIWEAKYALIINLLVGFGRALSEVGAIIIVGGNIAHLTRTMTTGIVLETSRGDLASAMSLGITLITIALFVNIILYSLKAYGEKNLV